MKTLNNRNKLIIIFATVLLFFCISINMGAAFKSNELKFIKPFARYQTVIFKSNKGELDTIKFYKFHIDTIRYHNIEQGFYNEYDLKVGYELTDNSYHKLITIPNNKKTDDFITYIKVKGSYETKEISFLGLVFENKFIIDAISSQSDSILFGKQDAVYEGVNINKGISSFVYSKTSGIISYSDITGSIWKRVGNVSDLVLTK